VLRLPVEPLLQRLVGQVARLGLLAEYRAPLAVLQRLPRPVAADTVHSTEHSKPARLPAPVPAVKDRLLYKNTDHQLPASIRTDIISDR